MKKLRLKDDYKRRLERWRLEATGCRDINLIQKGASFLFEPDTTITFADLKIGQAFQMTHIQPVTFRKMDNRVAGETANCVAISIDGKYTADRCGESLQVIPGKIIDGKFVPDEEAA